MNREIKFRAWDYKDKIFIEWEVLKYKTMHFFWDTRYKMVQFTGLKDSKGVEIYDGDIVRREENIKTGVVEWNEKWACFETTARYIEFDEMGDCEVIGNIYENPELTIN